MANTPMETPFKIVIALAIIVYSLFVVGIFLLIIKILLLFFTEINIMGVTLS
ncbi:hypothetical protein HY798_04250 [Candidatus Falkowbacteria bacterium]|nr:hypothetical protein [Candidatus Falkowbacteria bacterium]